MLRLRVSLLFPAFAVALVALAPARADKPRKPKPALAAAKYPLNDKHNLEHVTIAAEPCDTDESEPKTRLDYAHHGFLPMRVIITNDGDEPVSLDDARILFVAADNTVLNAASDEELQRRMFSRKSVAPTKIPLPAPLPSITIHHKPVDKQILADNTDFGFTTTTVAPHSTLAGYLYYDTRNVDDPVLRHATLELRRVRFATSNKALDTFDIALKPTDEKAAEKDAEKR